MPAIWPALRKELQERVYPEEFATWFAQLQVRAEDPRRLVLLAPNLRILDALEGNYRSTIDQAVRGLGRKSFRVFFALEGGTKPSGSSGESTDFISRYSFESFVVGSSNQFAHAAARAVAELPGKSYNPLFLYSGVGLGKTHLLHAIGQEVRRRSAHLVVRYLTCEQFVNELINAIRFDRMSLFRELMRGVDVLLLDDVQFLANKERTQEEFFHTFDALYARQKQIVLTSDSSPLDLPTLEERLRSRFEWGLIADIQPPDLETKVAILKHRARAEGIVPPEDVALFIATRVRANIRELEGSLNRVIAFAAITGRELDLASAKETLRDLLPVGEEEPAGAEGPQEEGAGERGIPSLPASFFATLGTWDDDRSPQEILRDIRNGSEQESRSAFD